MEKPESEISIKSLQRELEEVKNELKEKEKVFETILEYSFAGYWDWYIKDNYEYLSPTFKKMFGYEDHELANSPETWQKIIHPDDLEEVLNIFDAHVKSKGKIPYDNEVRYMHKDGSIVWVYCRGKVIEWDKEDNPVRMVGNHVNITRLKKLQEELEFFNFSVSHDLRVPLRTITGYAEILKEDYSDDVSTDAKRIIDKIELSTYKMSNLIDDILAFSRVSRKHNIAELQQINMTELFKEVYEELTQNIKERNIVFKIDQLEQIKGDKPMITQLITNLLSNAIKYSKTTEIAEISVSGEELGNDYVYTIKDNGVGFDMKFLSRIFKAFQRLHKDRDYEGTGVGLAIALKVIEHHNGRIWADSSPNEGSIFYFTIGT
ncbi:sensor histidine kinase [Chondrinema litorale]|uniref:sensor histidine kinase n=1 Tax=Chondrinema litorale TaxID=2994555 RepID=UPI0025432EBA|nr:PAS domain-containing sensor histidine kinase [Chondrinema litorale]UZR99514.1 PAS domain-containing protein [Chondrinema litorale]